MKSVKQGKVRYKGQPFENNADSQTRILNFQTFNKRSNVANPNAKECEKQKHYCLPKMQAEK